MTSEEEMTSEAQVVVTLHDDGAATVVFEDRMEQLTAPDPDEALKQALTIISAWATDASQSYDVSVRESDEEWFLRAHADGTVSIVGEEDEEGPVEAVTEEIVDEIVDEVIEEALDEIIEETVVAEEIAASLPPLPPTVEPEAAPEEAAVEAVEVVAEVVPVEVPPVYSPKRERRESFLTQKSEEPKATRGLRAFFRMAPGAAELRERQYLQDIAGRWPTAKTIAIVNGKGGSSKTTTTALLAAVFARFGGSGVLAWDNNQNRGTLGWRTQQSDHEATVLDLLPQTAHFLQPEAQSAELSLFVHEQGADRFDVLRSKPMELAAAQRITPADIDAIQAVASKYYRLIFIDSGNDESDPIWLRMIDQADQLVVATTSRDDHAEAAALLLEALEDRDPRSAALAKKAVVVINQADATSTPRSVERLAKGFRDLGNQAITIPFDQSMVEGSLHFEGLRARTQQAWFAAAAAVARNL